MPLHKSYLADAHAVWVREAGRDTSLLAADYGSVARKKQKRPTTEKVHVLHKVKNSAELINALSMEHSNSDIVIISFSNSV